MCVEKVSERLGSAAYNRSVKEGWSIWTLHGGLQQIPDAMASALRASGKVDIFTESPCTALAFTGDKAKVMNWVLRWSVAMLYQCFQLKVY